MDINKSEIRKIVKDELAALLNAELDKKVAELLKKSSSKTHKADNENTTESFENLYRFMYLRRNIWKKEV